MEAELYSLSRDGRSIFCRACGRASFNPQDVANRYCGFCHVFLGGAVAMFDLVVVNPLPDWEAADAAARSLLRVVIGSGGRLVRESLLGPWLAGVHPVSEHAVAELVDCGFLMPEWKESKGVKP